MRTSTINGLLFARIRSGFLLLALGALTAKSCAPKAYVPDTVSLQSIDSLPAQMPDLKRIEAVADSLAQSHLAEGATPGMSVAIAKDGKVVFSRGYGKADVEMNVSAGPQSVYNIGSLTKQFTAAIIMRLVERGEISLDDPIIKYLPEYPTQGNNVTIHHLLNHTSGIKSFRVLAEENRQVFRMDLPYEEMVEKFGTQPFDFEPGEKFSYNNMGYYLLGEIIGRVTGKSWNEYLETDLLQPLGLKNTTYCESSRIIPNRAEGYEYEEGKLINARFISMKVGGAAGALCSTTEDIIRWTHLLHTGQVVSLESVKLMTASTELLNGEKVPYGYGLSLASLDDHSVIGHMGASNGFKTLISHYPESKMTFAILTNSVSSKPLTIEQPLARLALDITLLDLSLTEEEMAKYIGDYTYNSKRRPLDMRVFAENGELKAHLLGKNPTSFKLLYQGNHVFVPIVDKDDRLIFTIQDGRAARFEHHEGKASVDIAKRKK